MAVADLLWACPLCGADRGIERPRKAAVCWQCGASFLRTKGARIQATTAEGARETRSAGEWVDRLPDPASLLDAAEGEVVRIARVTARFAVRDEVVDDRGRYLNRIEIYGDREDGELRLLHDRVTYHAASKGGKKGTGEASVPVHWTFDDLTAVQASSRKLQLKGRRAPLASFAFRDDSSFLWEHLLEAAVQRHYQRTGRGEIVEFQPRIRTR
ncbi:MAG TPA: hypothetical protein VK966_08115 [Longimicrobiales bacterium]|nr:hypothetical protein [Longimicrobiales bacterium]